MVRTGKGIYLTTAVGLSTLEHCSWRRAQTLPPAGLAVCFSSIRLGPDEIFTVRTLTEEQRLFGQTAAEFIQKKSFLSSNSYAHDWSLTRRLQKKASELDLLRLEVAAWPTAASASI
jgi:hypothetical protein